MTTAAKLAIIWALILRYERELRAFDAWNRRIARQLWIMMLLNPRL